MKKHFYDYFYYTRRERNGAIILACLCVLINVIPWLYPLIVPSKTVDFSEIQAAIEVWKEPQPTEEVPDTLFQFDPNTASEADLLQLGIPSRIVHTLINYREKGGRFYQKEDLKKIYGFPEELYDRLVDYIDIETVPKRPAYEYPKSKYAKRETPKPDPTPIVVDINQADVEKWKKLRGIGPVLSERIVKFRDKLGGFTSIEQVADTYGLPDSTFQSIRPQLKASPVLNKIAINQADAAMLQSHPYLNWRQAKAIVNYRDQHGPYTGIDDLKKLRLLTDDLCNRLAPYLDY